VLSPVRVPARFWPRDALDVVIVGAAGGAYVVVVNILPAVALYGALRLLHVSPYTSLQSALVCYFCLAAVFVLPMVRRLEIGPDGLRFVRLVGQPRWLAWHAITEIAPASRKEVLLDSFVWPLWPPREATMCLSSLGQYRIRFAGGVAYFPPRHPAKFEAAVRELRPTVPPDAAAPASPAVAEGLQ
jgi:hypothetical protein